MRVALIVALALLALTPGVARGDVEEVEYYDSLAAMTAHADAVVVGTVVSTSPGQQIEGGCGFTQATVRVESLVAGHLPPFAEENLTLQYFDCGTLPRLGIEIPAERSIFFLRNLRTDLRQAKPDATQAELDAAWPLWRLVILAGSGIDRAGRVHFPILNNATFLEPFEAIPFADFVARVRSLGRVLPNTATDTLARDPSSPAPIGPLLAGVAALLWILPRGFRRRPT